MDLTALDAHFERVFRAAGVREEWFKQVVQSALLTTILDAYSDFGAVGAAALEMMAAVHDVLLTRDDRNAILGAMRGCRQSNANRSPTCGRRETSGRQLTPLSQSG